MSGIYQRFGTRRSQSQPAGLNKPPRDWFARFQHLRNANVGKCHIVQSMSWPRSRADLSGSSLCRRGRGSSITAVCGGSGHHGEPLTHPPLRLNWNNATESRKDTVFIPSSRRFYTLSLCCFCVSVCVERGAESEASLRLISLLFQTFWNYNEKCRWHIFSDGPGITVGSERRRQKKKKKKKKHQVRRRRRRRMCLTELF